MADDKATVERVKQVLCCPATIITGPCKALPEHCNAGEFNLEAKLLCRFVLEQTGQPEVSGQSSK